MFNITAILGIFLKSKSIVWGCFFGWVGEGIIYFLIFRVSFLKCYFGDVNISKIVLDSKLLIFLTSLKLVYQSPVRVSPSTFFKAVCTFLTTELSFISQF